MCQLTCGSTPAHACANLCCLRAMCKQCETRGGRPRRTLDVFNQTTEAISFGIPNSHRRIKNLFRDLGHAVQQRTAAGQHDTAGELSFPTCVLDLVCNVHQHFFSAWLKDVAKDLARELAGWSSTNRRHIDKLATFHLAQRTTTRAANRSLDLFRFRNRRAQSERNVVREVRATERKNCRVLDGPTLVDNQPSRLRADVDERSAKLFVIFS